MSAPPLVVLDDDPTGTQAMAGVPVLLEPDEAALRELADGGAPAVHLLTNSRALDPADAERLVGTLARAVQAATPGAEVVLRGDSTLRGHLLEEYRGLASVRFPDQAPVHLLVPALPAAGRVTVDGVHLLDHDGVRVPLHRTEYAEDPVLGYRDARLLNWAEERSGGYFPARWGCEVHLKQVRQGGGTVAAALLRLATAGRPAVCAVDAETLDDLAAIAAGLREARAAAAPVIVRCAPPFVGVLSGALARRLVAPPHVAGPVAVIAGSFVPTTTRQLAHLASTYPGTLIEADVGRLASADASAELDRLARAADDLLVRRHLAVVATPRVRPPSGDLALQARVAASLAGVLPRLRTTPGIVIAKGGVTAGVTARLGLGGVRADVIGPIEAGVSLWRVHARDGRTLPYLVVPGNVGDDVLLGDLVAAVSAVRPAPCR